VSTGVAQWWGGRRTSDMWLPPGRDPRQEEKPPRGEREMVLGYLRLLPADLRAQAPGPRRAAV